MASVTRRKTVPGARHPRQKETKTTFDPENPEADSGALPVARTSQPLDVAGFCPGGSQKSNHHKTEDRIQAIISTQARGKHQAAGGEGLWLTRDYRCNHLWRSPRFNPAVPATLLLGIPRLFPAHIKCCYWHWLPGIYYYYGRLHQI